MTRPTTVDTLVVGAGIAGLSYAHGLGPGADVLVLEAGARVGGLITTAPFDDGHVERGPEALQGSAPHTLALLEELGLQPLPAPAAAARRYLLGRRGRLEPLPSGPGSALTTPVLNPLGKLRALCEPWRAGDRALDGSVADFVRHRLGRQVLDELVDPFVSGVYAGDPERLSLRAAFPTLAELVEEHGSLLAGLKARGRARRAAGTPRPKATLLSVAGGLEAIPRRLGEVLGEGLVTGLGVCSVARAEPGFRVSCRGDEEGTIGARRLVLAVPAAAAATLLAQLDAPLSQELSSMQSEPVVSVAHAWPRSAVRHPLDGFGYLVPSARGRRHLGTLFSSSIQPDRCAPDRVVLRTLLGGARRPELIERDDGELVDLVLDEVGPLLGLEGRPRAVDVARWPAALPRYDLDQVSRQDRIEAGVARHDGLSLLGNYRRGISVNALIENSRTLAAAHRDAHRDAHA